MQYFLWLGHTIIIIQKNRVIHKADRPLQTFTGQTAEFHKTSIQKGQQGKQTNSEPHKSPVLEFLPSCTLFWEQEINVNLNLSVTVINNNKPFTSFHYYCSDAQGKLWKCREDWWETWETGMLMAQIIKVQGDDVLCSQVHSHHLRLQLGAEQEKKRGWGRSWEVE